MGKLLSILVCPLYKKGTSLTHYTRKVLLKVIHFTPLTACALPSCLFHCLPNHHIQPFVKGLKENVLFPMRSTTYCVGYYVRLTALVLYCIVCISIYCSARSLVHSFKLTLFRGSVCTPLLITLMLVIQIINSFVVHLLQTYEINGRLLP